MSELDKGNQILQHVPEEDQEREAFLELDPKGFFIRHPPKPHVLQTFITPDEDLFQTIHMGAAVVNSERWLLVVSGFVRKPFALGLSTLKQLPQTSTISFHECYGSPLKPATEALWRIGNVRWTGVPLGEILRLAEPLDKATFVWSEGLDRGEFAGVATDRYQKDLPINKAWQSEVLLAYEMNGKPLDRKRGGPVRLVVPGWFGTNSTKWISKIILQDHRATGPFTTNFYNEPDPAGPPGKTRPVWQVEVNSLIFHPVPGSVIQGPVVSVKGWAWHGEPVKKVEISVDDGLQWIPTHLSPRQDFSWQMFSTEMHLDAGEHVLLARATSCNGDVQPLSGRRNHCHRVEFEVV